MSGSSHWFDGHWEVVDAVVCLAAALHLRRSLPKRPEVVTTIGYDGQNVEYRERAVLAANDNVRNAILQVGRTMIVSYWGKVAGDERIKWEGRWRKSSSVIC